MYPEALIAPIRTDLVSAGFTELTAPGQVDEVMSHTDGTTLLVINSVCGCAAGTARPGVKLAVNRAAHKPTHLTTVFAGVDFDATDKAREYTMPYPPSSPSIALFKNGELVHFVERHHIEDRSAEMIAQHLEQVFDEFCA